MREFTSGTRACHRSRILLACITTLFSCAVAIAQNPPEAIQPQLSQPLLYWAYPVNPPSDKNATSAEQAPRQVPGSSAAFSPEQVEDRFNPPDWHPDRHPALPDIVAHGHKPNVFACAFCHLPNGQGRPENASVAGLPAAYIIQQFADFKSGVRKGSEPLFLPGFVMGKYESNSTPEEIKAAAQYFSGLKRKPWIRVVETDSVPKTHAAGWMLVPDIRAEKEPIGQRIIETAEDIDRCELRDDSSSFVAYVPPGSLKRGEALVNTGGAGKTMRCAGCHGPGLKGKGNVPPLAGRSPSYIVRQLNDIQRGTRAGVATQLMKKPVAKLTLDDMIAIAAYIASQNP
jgi:cytochrome c553